METLSELAARWTVRADAGTLSPEEQRELDSWLAADPRHLGAYVRARAQWVDLDRLAALQGFTPRQEKSPANSRTEAPDCDLGVASGVVTTPKSAMTTTNMFRRGLLAAAIAGVGVLGGGLSLRMFSDDKERYSSGIGEMRRIALVDGSMLLLNTDSEVIVRLTKQQRNIQLARGEALFEVAHDKSRPFIVQANDARVRAVGTAFAVRVQEAQVEVTVAEGVVEVTDVRSMSGLDPIAPSASRVGVERVTAHERAIISSARPPEVLPIAPAEVERQLAWREGLVSFEGETLLVAVSEINRHNRHQIVIDEPRLASLPIVGVFRATDLQGFAAAAAAALNARATVDGDLIRLQAKSTKR